MNREEELNAKIISTTKSCSKTAKNHYQLKEQLHLLHVQGQNFLKT